MTKILDDKETELYLDWVEKTYPERDPPKSLPEYCDEMLEKLREAALNNEIIYFHEYNTKERDALAVLIASGEADFTKNEKGYTIVEYASKLEVSATKILRKLTGSNPSEPNEPS